MRGAASPRSPGRVPRRVFQRLLPERPTPAVHRGVLSPADPVRESIDENKLRRRAERLKSTLSSHSLQAMATGRYCDLASPAHRKLTAPVGVVQVVSGKLVADNPAAEMVHHALSRWCRAGASGANGFSR